MNSASQSPATTSAMGHSFEEIVLPHLDAAYRLARWIMRNDEDAEDVVQEACLRAFRYFKSFAGGNGRAWFFRIVRNACADWRAPKWEASADVFDEELHSAAQPAENPETLMLHTDDVELVRRAISMVPERFRELLVLRELEGLSYRELAEALDIPMGTVMSGLSRARQSLRAALDNELRQGYAVEEAPDKHETPALA